MNHGDYVPKYLRGRGVEIGAYKTPIPGIRPYYVDKYTEFANEPCPLIDYLCDATRLPFYTSSLDYVASSHVLEHMANPVKALVEWRRATRPGGCVYCVIPDKRKTFDRERETTPVEHMLADYANDIDDADPTHIDDFVYGIDWAAVRPEDKPEDRDAIRREHRDRYLEATGRGAEINIHFHVFEPDQFAALVETANARPEVDLRLRAVEIVPDFPSETPNGFLAVLRNEKRESPLAPLSRLLRRLACKTYPVLPTARRANAPPGVAGASRTRSSSEKIGQAK